MWPIGYHPVANLLQCKTYIYQKCEKLIKSRQTFCNDYCAIYLAHPVGLCKMLAFCISCSKLRDLRPEPKLNCKRIYRES